MEILRCVAKGLSNKAIAKELHLSLYTVKAHVHRILEKTGSATRDQAVGKILHLKPMQSPCEACPVTHATKFTQKAKLFAADLRRMADELEGI
jgi:transposase